MLLMYRTAVFEIVCGSCSLNQFTRRLEEKGLQYHFVMIFCSIRKSETSRKLIPEESFSSSIVNCILRSILFSEVRMACAFAWLVIIIVSSTYFFKYATGACFGRTEFKKWVKTMLAITGDPSVPIGRPETCLKVPPSQPNSVAILVTKKKISLNSSGFRLVMVGNFGKIMESASSGCMLVNMLTMSIEKSRSSCVKVSVLT